MLMNIPVILLKELVILPNQEVKIELNNELSRQIIKEASLNNNGRLLVVAPLDFLEEEPSIDDLPKVGVIAKIKNKIALSDSVIRVTLRGLNRVAINKYYPSNNQKDMLYSEILDLKLPLYEEKEEKAIRRKLLNILEEYISSSSNISNSILIKAKETNNLDYLTDLITSFLPFNLNKKLEYMQNINPLNRAIALIKDINEEIKYNELEEELDLEVQKELDKSQKEFILKEKLNIIQKELGLNDNQDEEINYYIEVLDKLRIDKRIKEKINREINRLKAMNYASPEVSVIRSYLDWLLNLPWNKETKEEKNFNLIAAKLDESHYGLKEIKNRIIEYIAMKNINPDIKSPIICLVGPPGVGKTSIALSIARALNRKFCKINVGGLNDSTELIGSRRTYLGANPGKIIQGLRKAEAKNPVILIDEVDKMVKDYKGDPASTLLEILDPIQNAYFTDNYIEEPFSLSNVLFILTANYIEAIPPAILDRLEVIEVNSYTIFEKKDIAKNYLLPKIYAEHKVMDNKLRISDELLYFLISGYTNEAGVRDLERTLSSLIRKLMINNIKTITKEKIIKYLGLPKYLDDDYDFSNLYGVSNALAYTPGGGKVTKIEVLKFKGNKGKIITGQVGPVMDESILVSLSYIEKEYNYNLSNWDFHIHFLEGSLPKDGSSAGVSITSAILSSLEKKIIPSDIAFTGEITLNGNILKVGGLKEKLISAYNKGIKVVYIPSSNYEDLENIPNKVKENMTINLVRNYKEIYTKLFK